MAEVRPLGADLRDAAFTSYAARSVAPPPYPHAPPLQAYAYGGPFSGGAGGAGAGAAYGYGYGNPACGGYSHRDAGAPPRVGGGGGVKRSRYDDAQRGSDDTLCLRRLPEWVGEDSLAGLVSNLPGYRHLKLLPTNGTKTLFVLFESASLAAAGLEALQGREVCGSPAGSRIGSRWRSRAGRCSSPRHATRSGRGGLRGARGRVETPVEA